MKHGLVLLDTNSHSPPTLPWLTHRILLNFTRSVATARFLCLGYVHSRPALQRLIVPESGLANTVRTEPFEDLRLLLAKPFRPTAAGLPSLVCDQEFRSSYTTPVAPPRSLRLKTTCR